MTIQTKFDLGDEAFYMASNVVKRAPVERMEIRTYRDGEFQMLKTSICCLLKGEEFMRDEFFLYPSKEALLASL